MNIIQFSLKMFLSEKKKAFHYIFSCTFSVIVMFLFLNIFYNPNYFGTSEINAFNFNKILSRMLSFLVIVLIVLMSLYAYHFYLINQSKELGIFLLGGSKSSNTLFYLFIQQTIIFSIALILGLFFGVIFVPFSNYLMNVVLGLDVSIFFYHPTAFFGTLILTLISLCFMALFSSGFMQRHEIKDMIGMVKESRKKDTRMIELPKLFYIFLILLPFGFYIFERNPQINIVIAFFSILCGFKGFCQYVVIDIFKFLQHNIFIKKRYGLIASAHVQYLFVNTSPAIMFFLFIVMFMNTYILSNIHQPLNAALILLAYICLVISVIMSLYYRILLEENKNKTTFSHLYKMGYKKDEIIKIIRLEIFAVYFILFMILFVHIGMFYIGCIRYQLITLPWVIFNMSIFTLAILVMGSINYMTYKQSVLKELK